MDKVEVPLYYDGWMDNGLENLFRLLSGKEFSGVIDIKLENEKLVLELKDKKAFLKKLASKIKQRRDQTIFVEIKDKESGARRNIKKEFIVLAYGKQIKGKNVLIEKLFNDNTINRRLRQVFENLNAGKKICVICGHQFSKSVDNLKQAVHPLTTKIKSLSGVRSMKDYYDALCPLCYLIGVLEWVDEGIIYRCGLGKGGKKYSVVFLPVADDLLELHRFKTAYLRRGILKTGNLSSNLTTQIVAKGREMEFPVGEEYSTLLRFFEKFFYNAYFRKEKKKSWLDYSKIKQEICQNWILMQVPGGNVKNIKFEKLRIPNTIFQMIYSLTKGNFWIFSSFVSKIYFKGRQPNRSKVLEIREKISKNIIKNNFDKFSKLFLPRGSGAVFLSKKSLEILDKVIFLWRWKNMGLTEEELKMVKSAGRTVAAVTDKHISVLYKIDKARNTSALLDALRQVSKYVSGMPENLKERYKAKGFFYPPAIEELLELLVKNESKNIFQDIKNVLVIYSSVGLARLAYKGNKGGSSK